MWRIKRILFFHKLYYLNLAILSAFSTLYCRISLRIRGVILDRGSKFVGVPMIYMFPKSKIVIGRSVEIRSARMSNFIGINRMSIIATHGENAEVKIGDFCGMSGTVIGAKKSITIGNNVMIGANVLITDFDWHSLDPTARSQGASSESNPIIIGDNVFIGYSAIILKGVSVGKNSVIGANSVVTSNIPANVIAAGNPCKVISELK